jgi:hypothetical protein
MRIVITSGAGTGQYGYITDYNNVSKVITVARESDDQPGWDHVVPGKLPTIPLLTNTTYRIEPRVIFSAPAYSATQIISPVNTTWSEIVYGETTETYTNVAVLEAGTGTVDVTVTAALARFNVTKQGRDYTLTLNNKEVFEFYKKHNIDFENMNITFLNILKNLILNMDTSLNTNIASKLLENVTSLTNKVETINNSISKYQTDISSLLIIKFNEYRKEYIDDLKLILTSNNVEHIYPLIRETNNNLIDKTSLIISDLIPKNQDVLSKDINSNFKLLQSSIISETSKLLSSSLD